MSFSFEGLVSFFEKKRGNFLSNLFHDALWIVGTLKGKDDSSAKSKKGRKVQFDAGFPRLLPHFLMFSFYFMS